MYCDLEGLPEPTGECYGGYFCEEGSHIPDLKPCDKGHFCPNGTEYQIPCPSGTFNGKERKRKEEREREREREI